MRRSASLAAALAAIALLGAAFGACYDVPQPVCGFRCGPSQACPEDYTCDPADGRCHLNGSEPMTCMTLDGSLPDDLDVDAPDAMVDAPDASMLDATDAMLDATDAMLDATDAGDDALMLAN